jgi:rhodanese-related sulfurtransferase
MKSTLTNFLRGWKFAPLLCVLALGSGSLPAADEPPVVRNLAAPDAIKLVSETGKKPDKPAATPALTVLDVRTPGEFAAGRIKGAVNVDFRAPDFEKRLAQLDKNRPYLVHCARGNRSAKTRDLMEKLGFKKINHLEGGLAAWEKAGGPVEKTPAAGKN